MEEPKSPRWMDTLPTIWPQELRDVQVIILLLLIALAIRGCVVWLTEVPARDSIGFIRYALLFEKEDWTQVIKESYQHPGYPVWLLTVSWPIRALTGKTDCYTMQYSAQLASALAGWLIVIPMFYLGKSLFNRGVGFWAALFFQCSPSSGQTLSDAISDPLFLLLATTSLLTGVLAIRNKAIWQFACCGVLCGLTYLVRPEGMLVLAAVAVVLGGTQLMPAFRRPWRKVLACGSALLLGSALAGSPYYLVTGNISNKPSVERLFDKLIAENNVPHEEKADLSNRALFASIFGVHVHMDEHDSIIERLSAGLWAVCMEFMQAYFYLGWIPLLLGIFWYRHRYRVNPGVYVVSVYFVLQCGVVWWLTMTAGYVSDRHILPLVIASVSLITAAIIEIPFRIRRMFSRNSEPTAEMRHAGRYCRVAVVSLVLMLLMVGAGLTRTLRPLHGHREGHHAAGVWLRTHAQKADTIVDDHCWAHYYADRVFEEGKPTVIPADYRPARYIVYSRPKHSGTDRDHREYDEKTIQQMGGIPVYHWPPEAAFSKAQVIVYRIEMGN